MKKQAKSKQLLEKNKNKTYVIDLDHTLCDTKKKKDGNWDYLSAKPFRYRIKKINKLFDKGNKIIIDTARGSVSGINWKPKTTQQLKKWGLKFHKLRSNIKFPADYYIDDKAINSEIFFKK